MLRAIDERREDGRAVFGLVRSHGTTYPEATRLLGASAVTVKRQLSRSVRLLAERLVDHRPGERPADSI
jgi:DNA-directed RNA polymerase specialized sigma24 family protein